MRTARERPVRPQAAEQEVRVGHRRQLSPKAVTGRSWVGADFRPTQVLSHGEDRSDHDFHVGRNTVEGAHLMLDLADNVRRRGLGHAAQANQKQNEQRTSN